MKPHETNEFYDFGEFRLDPRQRCLWRGGEVVALTPKEFEVLFFLVKSASQVVEKNELLDAVWTDVYVEETTLARNVSWLRQKLGAGNGAGKMIETVPKRGYRFAADVTTSGKAEIFVEETTLTRVRVEETITLPEIINAETTRREEPEKEIPALVSAERNIALVPKAAPLLPLPRRSFLFVALAVIAAASIGFIIYQNYYARTNATARFAANVKPFSGARGRENTPAFSWNGGERENSDIYVQIIGAGEPVRLTDTEVHEQYPVFSPDGTHIAFVRDFKTHGEIILIPALGGAERIVAGKWIYYTKNSPEIGLRRVSAAATAENSDEAQIPKVNNEGFQNAWTLTKNGVYFIAPADHSPAVIKFYDFATERISDIVESDRFKSSAFAGMTVSPDGKTVLFAQFDQNASSIMLAELEK